MCIRDRLANYPIALASGMGLNAYFAYTICLGEMADNPNAWQIALTAILVEGFIFILLSAFRFRETLVNKIPMNLKYGITAGIGLFITFIGLQNAGIAISEASTKVTLGDVGSAPVALALVGLIVIGLMTVSYTHLCGTRAGASGSRTFWNKSI